jgi:hypothetical protein
MTLGVDIWKKSLQTEISHGGEFIQKKHIGKRKRNKISPS